MADASTPMSSTDPVRLPPPATAEQAAATPRLVVESLSPSVEGGDYPVRRVVGEEVMVGIPLVSG